MASYGLNFFLSTFLTGHENEQGLLFRHGRGILFFTGRQCTSDRCHCSAGANECRTVDDAAIEAFFRDVLRRACRFCRRFCRCTAQRQGHVHHQHGQILRLQPDFRRCPSPPGLCCRRAGCCRVFSGQVRYSDRAAAGRKTGDRQWLDRGVDCYFDCYGDCSGGGR